MAVANWSMSALGFPAHARATAPVVAVTHMSTFLAMRFAEKLGLATGWLQAQGDQPQLDRLTVERPTWVALTDLFAQSRVVATEGLASGRLVLAAAATTGQQPDGRPLEVWAAASGLPWIEIVDNEVCYWGGLDDKRIERLLTWFALQRLADTEWPRTTIDRRLGSRLRHGLFDHGWTRCLALVRPERKSTDLWGGLHRTCLIRDHGAPALSQVQSGVRVRLDLGELIGSELTETCPLADETGKLVPGRASGLWTS